MPRQERWGRGVGPRQLPKGLWALVVTLSRTGSHSIGETYDFIGVSPTAVCVGRGGGAELGG